MEFNKPLIMKGHLCLSMVECTENSILVGVWFPWCMPRLHVVWGSRHHWAGFFLHSSHLVDNVGFLVKDCDEEYCHVVQ